MTTFPSVCGGYGIRGDKGDPGQGIFFQGPWDASESYIPGDMVTDDDGIFIAVEAIAPGTPPGEDTSWRLLVLWSEITGPPADLEHWHHDTFRAVWRNRAMREEFVWFTRGRDGGIDSLHIDWNLRPAMLQVGAYPSSYRRTATFQRVDDGQ